MGVQFNGGWVRDEWKRKNGPTEKVSFQLVLEIRQRQMTGLLLVVCSMMLA